MTTAERARESLGRGERGQTKVCLQFQTMGSVGADLSGAFGLNNARIGLMIGLFMAPGLFLVLPAGVLGRFA